LTRGALSLALLAVACGGTACGLFESRDPMDPGTDTFPCASLENPNNVFENLRKSFGQGAGLGCYTATFDPTFYFHGDPTDSTDAPDSFEDWTKTVEEQVSQGVANDADPLEVAVTYKGLPEVVTSTPDLEIRRYTYEIVYAASAIPDTLFQGIAEITIRRSTTGLWQITEWFDRRDPAGTTTRTWGFLRASYRI
jgi:hypothetical protein